MENINQFTKIGTFCEICRNVVCICKIGENSALDKATLFDENDDCDDGDDCDFCNCKGCRGSCVDEDF